MEGRRGLYRGRTATRLSGGFVGIAVYTSVMHVHTNIYAHIYCRSYSCVGVRMDTRVYPFPQRDTRILTWTGDFSFR